jgi:hypothetical protein
VVLGHLQQLHLQAELLALVIPHQQLQAKEIMAALQ